MKLTLKKSTYVNGVPDVSVASHVADHIAALPLADREGIIFTLLTGNDPAATIRDMVIDCGRQEIKDAYQAEGDDDV